MSIWLTDTELASLPASGPAWAAMKAAADSLSGKADIDNQDEKQGEKCLAAALCARKLNNTAYHDKAATLLRSAPESENGGRTLALGRNLAAYVIAAAEIEFREPAFVNWLAKVRTETLSGMTLVSTHEKRANNWGTASGASRIAAAVYLEDDVDLARAARVMKGWLGDRAAYSGFDFGDLAWQADPKAPVGINPKGATRNGINVDGCLPDDQRRTGGLVANPPAGNYVRAAISHSFVSATLLWNAGIDVFSASDEALRRAVQFFTQRAKGTFSGDDGWAVSLIEWAYPGLEAGADAPGSVGKTMAWTAWTHGDRARGEAPAPPPDEPPPPPPGPSALDRARALGVAISTASTLAAAKADAQKVLDL